MPTLHIVRQLQSLRTTQQLFRQLQSRSGGFCGCPMLEGQQQILLESGSDEPRENENCPRMRYGIWHTKHEPLLNRSKNSGFQDDPTYTAPCLSPCLIIVEGLVIEPCPPKHFERATRSECLMVVIWSQYQPFTPILMFVLAEYHQRRSACQNQQKPLGIGSVVKSLAGLWDAKARLLASKQKRPYFFTQVPGVSNVSTNTVFPVVPT